MMIKTEHDEMPSMRGTASQGILAVARLLSSTAAVAAITFASTAQSATIETIATGLNNPRGLNFGPEGALYVAEAGVGGSGPCGAGAEGERCYGASGSITRLDLRRGTQERISTGLPSLAAVDGSSATGPHDISFVGRGNAVVSIGFGGNPFDRATLFPGVGANFGKMVRLTGNGNWSFSTDLGAYEGSANPARDQIDTNPYGVLALPGKDIVVDAGANALNQIAANGKVTTLAIFPDRLVDTPPNSGFPPQFPMDAVPTCVALGPDGNYYVGQLTGAPFPVGGANIYRVPAKGGIPQVVESGFTHIIDIAFGEDGSLYVLEIAKNGLLGAFIGGDWTGALIRIAPNGTRTEIASAGLFAPGGLALGPDGAIYVTNNSILGGEGQVLKIVP